MSLEEPGVNLQGECLWRSLVSIYRVNVSGGAWCQCGCVRFDGVTGGLCVAYAFKYGYH